MTIRLACASTFAAIGFACSSTGYARVVVYMSAPVVYAPPPQPVLVNRVYVTAPPPAPIPVVAPPSANYAIVPAPVVSYAQPVLAVPR